MTLKRFRRIARKAIADLPAMFHPHVDELLILIKRRPAPRLLRELQIAADEDLLGLYDGPPLTERSVSDAAEMPPTIILFYEPLLDACDSVAELKHEIQLTVLHEIGHFFGLDEQKLAELGYD